MAWCKWPNFYRETASVFCNFWLPKEELFRNHLRIDFVDTFDNCDKLRNGIITNAIYKILENVFTSCFLVILEIHLRYIVYGNVLFIS